MSDTIFRQVWRRLAVLAAVVVWAFLLAGVKLVPFAPLLWEHVQLGGQGRPIAWRATVAWATLFGAMAAAPAVRRLTRRHAVAWTAGVVVTAVIVFLLLCPYDDSTPPERRARALQTLNGLTGFPAAFPGAEDDDDLAGGLDPDVSPVGWIGLVLAAAAVVTRPRRIWRLVVLAGLLLWIELGPAVPLDLMKSVRGLPGINVIRKPRHWINMYLAFSLSLLAGRGAMLPAEWLRRRVGRAIPWALAALALVCVAWVGWPLYRESVSHPVPDLGPRGDYEVIVEGYTVSDYEPLFVYRNVCALKWRLDLQELRARALQVRRFGWGHPVNEDYRGNVFFQRTESPNRASLKAFTPLDIQVAVEVKEPGVLCINQIRDDDWRTSEGRVVPTGRLLRVHLDRRGTYRVRLRYVPVLFYWGLGVTLVSLLGGVTVIVVAARRRRRGPRA